MADSTIEGVKLGARISFWSFLLGVGVGYVFTKGSPIIIRRVTQANETDPPLARPEPMIDHGYYAHGEPPPAEGMLFEERIQDGQRRIDERAERKNAIDTGQWDPWLEE